jgi:rhodanese-related sulfurtransferase
MAMHTVATLPRLSSTELSQILLSNTSSNLDASTSPSKIAIVDVRDDGMPNLPHHLILRFRLSSAIRRLALTPPDHIGGHIRHSIHAPSHTLDHKIPELVRKLKDKETVVFHCALSQQRGPSAALRYIRERERLLGPNAKTKMQSRSGVGEVMRKNKELEGKVEDKYAEWTDVEEEGGKEQKVYVLDRGFVGWQERYGEDSRLTEGYRKEIWKGGYWM